MDEHLWNALHSRALSERTSVSELVRQAVRERYLGNKEERAKAMQSFVGIRKHQTNAVDAVEYVRSLRRDSRLDDLQR